MTWRDKALCKGKHIDLWYPPLEADNQEEYYAVAREVCHACPVWRKCLNDGMSEQWGMWGGLTPLERTAFSKKPKKTALKPHGTVTRYRQGCYCKKCVNVNETVKQQNKDFSVVPTMQDKDFDLFTILYQLLQ